jgi:hypothetical protein
VSRIQRNLPQPSAFNAVAQLACDKRADDQKQIEGHEIVTPDIQGESMRNQYWIGARKYNALRLDSSHHPDKACRGQQWQ